MENFSQGVTIEDVLLPYRLINLDNDLEAEFISGINVFGQEYIIPLAPINSQSGEIEVNYDVVTNPFLATNPWFYVENNVEGTNTYGEKLNYSVDNNLNIKVSKEL